MDKAWPYISFVLGAGFALLVQLVNYRLGVRKDKRKEYWIRTLNSYQDYNQQVSQLIGLLRAGVQVPENVVWQSVTAARKAAYDASFYDSAHPSRTELMQEITIDLLSMLRTDENRAGGLAALEARLESIRAGFRDEEGIPAWFFSQRSTKPL